MFVKDVFVKLSCKSLSFTKQQVLCEVIYKLLLAKCTLLLLLLPSKLPYCVIKDIVFRVVYAYYNTSTDLVSVVTFR